jgi:hypothetical protein
MRDALGHLSYYRVARIVKFTARKTAKTAHSNAPRAKYRQPPKTFRSHTPFLEKPLEAAAFSAELAQLTGFSEVACLYILPHHTPNAYYVPSGHFQQLFAAVNTKGGSTAP